MKTAILTSLFALSATVLALPPACLLQAVNTQDSPADLSAICGDAATDVQSAIASVCGDNQSVAQSAFLSTCSAAGSSVAPYTASSTKSSSKSSHTSSSHASHHTTTTQGTFVYTTAVFDPDCSCSSTLVTSATGAAAASSLGLTATAAATAASATGASPTGNVAPEITAFGHFAAAAIAVVGVVAAL